MWVSREASISELVEELRPLLDPSLRERPIRCMDVADHKIMRVRQCAASCESALCQASWRRAVAVRCLM